VVLVDEIDLHLHPRWQRRILLDLVNAFPRLQFITTTHSPQVLASAKREWVRVVGGGRVAPLIGHVEGRDSNAILEDILGVNARPIEWEDRIRKAYEAIEEGELDQADRLLESELAPLGPDDIDVVRLRWQLHAARTPLEEN
jgi:predicted ATP-binding protein involved in virulence